MFNKNKEKDNALVVKKNKPKIEMSKNEKILLGVVVTGVIGYGLYAFVFSPLTEKLKPLEAEVKTLQATVNSRRNIDDQLIETRKILGDKEKEYTQVSVKVPDTDRYPEISRTLHNTAFYNNVKVKSVTFAQPVKVNYGDLTAAAPAPVEGAPQVDPKREEAFKELREAKNGFYKYTVTVNYEGSFMHVLNFIKAMEGKEQILELVNITTKEEKKEKENSKNDKISRVNKITEEINKLTLKINELIEKSQIEEDQVKKDEMLREVTMLQKEREAKQGERTAIFLSQDDGKNNTFTVTSGAMTFDYYTKGEIKTENHNFNVGNYGKEDVFK